MVRIIGASTVLILFHQSPMGICLYLYCLGFVWLDDELWVSEPFAKC